MARVAAWMVGLLCGLALTGHGAKPPAASSSERWLFQAEHTPKQPRTGQTVKVTVAVRPGVNNVTLQYQVVDPGNYVELKDAAYESNWISLPMQAQSKSAGTNLFVAEVPAKVQTHRRLIRYRVAAADSDGAKLRAPAPEAMPPNYAYFVYDGIPAWKGAIDPQSQQTRLSSPVTFSAEAMRRVQAYHLLGKRSSIENATWNEQAGGKEYKYTGTLVVDGEVHDHISFRARGGVWRYAMGKNMWKFSLPGDQSLTARDDFARPYPVHWSKVNLRACIQQGDYGMRGEQGMFESMGFRLFNLAGVPAPFTHWIQLRIIDEADENPDDQYRGDFWGLYLAIENEDGKFLKAHGLPEGNLYKMEGGGGELAHHGMGAVTNSSDLYEFMEAYSHRSQPDAWWRTNLDLAGYYSYRAICECIHHYDIGDGKNYDYFRNQKSGQWQVLPWDIDLTWANHMYGSGEDPFKRRVLARAGYRLEYQNRLREIRDLLFNPEQTGQMIDEYAAVIWDPSGGPSMVEADRRKWDYHPALQGSIKGGNGKFYEATRSRDFAGMVRLMKDYVRSRGAWIDANLLNDSSIPETPTATYTGPSGFPPDQLRFKTSAYQGSNPFAAIRWRLARVTDSKAAPGPNRERRAYEISAIWESAEMTNPNEVISILPNLVKSGLTYRVRTRTKDKTGRWSHWSPPVEFVAGNQT